MLSFCHLAFLFFFFSLVACPLCVLFFFFLMIRRPPRPTLFPYPTPFRSRRSRPASAPPTPHCFAAWKPPTPNEPASWKNAHGCARRTPGSAGNSPSPSADSGRPGPAEPEIGRAHV